MKFLFTLLSTTVLSFTAPVWLTDMNQAQVQAHESHKPILLSFSGSDWCIPCIRLHKEVFESESFQEYANGNLVLVNADFPRLKKNKLSKEQTQQNEALAARYNSSGSFPLTLLLDDQGKVLKKWEGESGLTPEKLTTEIDAFIHGNH